MPLIFNGNEPKNITYNGNEVKKVIYNGNVVWEKQTEAFVPSFVSCVALNPTDNKYAKVGTAIWVYVTLPKDIQSLPKVKINGVDARVFANQHTDNTDTYVGELTMTNDMPEGTVEFLIYDYVSADGVVGEDITETTNGTSVYLDKTQPVITVSNEQANPYVTVTDNALFIVQTKIDEIVVRTDGSQPSGDGQYVSFFGIGYFGSGHYEIVATDNAGNVSTYEWERTV